MKPKLTLNRDIYTEYCIIGKVLDENGKFLCSSLENPWQNNQANISCIPAGRYNVERDNTGKFQYYKILNVVGRDNIEIHQGNFAKDTRGCVLFGHKPCYFENKEELGITSSKRTLHQITIRYPDGFLLEIDSRLYF